jgi:hypothetical protein
VSTGLIIVIAVVVLVMLLALGGTIANARRLRAHRAELEATLLEADRALAAAHAGDKGWDRAALEAAVRQAVAQREPDASIEELALLKVVDPPGIAEDQAVFRVVTARGESTVTLLRRDDGWVAA